MHAVAVFPDVTLEEAVVLMLPSTRVADLVSSNG